MQEQVATSVEEAIVDMGLLPSFLMTRKTVRDAMTDHFAILLALLSAAAVTSVLVGLLGLATTMSLNILERLRELGVMRSIGATRTALLCLLLLEGCLVAAASVLPAIVLSFPLLLAVGALIGSHGLHVSLPLVIAPWAIAAWLAVALAGALIACVLPARNALRLPVRNVLTYE